MLSVISRGRCASRKVIRMSESPTPDPPRERTRLSTSTAIPTSRNISYQEIDEDQEVDLAVDTHALARAIGEFWKIDDPQLVVLQYGGQAVARAHRRMLYMSRQQKLAAVRSLEGYFMRILIGRPQQDDPIDEERSDDYYEEYLRRQQERGL